MNKSPAKLALRSAIITLALFFSFSSTSFTQNGIHFSEGSWDDILAKAKAKNTLVFVDAYTTWCGPCKMMAKNVFTLQEVGDFYNENFVNAKIDMEKGEGVELARNYNVRAYPTYLFVDAGGTLVHRAVGYIPGEDFIEAGKTALDPDNWLSSLAKRYDSGDRDPDFLYKYAQSAYKAMEDIAPEVAEAFLKSQNDYNNDKSREIIFRLADNTDSEYYNYIAENRADFNEQFGEDMVTGQLFRTIFYENIRNPNQQEALQKAEALIQKSFGEEAEKYNALFKLSYFEATGDWENYAQTALQYYTDNPSENSDELNSVAWSFYEVVEDKKMLKKAVKWAKKSVKLDRGYYNNDTLAALYYKLGKKGKARKIAQKAIDIAKANGEDYSSTQELLDKIKAM